MVPGTLTLWGQAQGVDLLQCWEMTDDSDDDNLIYLGQGELCIRLQHSRIDKVQTQPSALFLTWSPTIISQIISSDFPVTGRSLSSHTNWSAVLQISILRPASPDIWRGDNGRLRKRYKQVPISAHWQDWRDHCSPLIFLLKIFHPSILMQFLNASLMKRLGLRSVSDIWDCRVVSVELTKHVQTLRIVFNVQFEQLATYILLHMSLLWEYHGEDLNKQFLAPS